MGMHELMVTALLFWGKKTQDLSIETVLNDIETL